VLLSLRLSPGVSAALLLSCSLVFGEALDVERAGVYTVERAGVYTAVSNTLVFGSLTFCLLSAYDTRYNAQHGVGGAMGIATWPGSKGAFYGCDT
jgi:hypothetical protein